MSPLSLSPSLSLSLSPFLHLSWPLFPADVVGFVGVRGLHLPLCVKQMLTELRGEGEAVSEEARESLVQKQQAHEQTRRDDLREKGLGADADETGAGARTRRTRPSRAAKAKATRTLKKQQQGDDIESDEEEASNREVEQRKRSSSNKGHPATGKSGAKKTRGGGTRRQPIESDSEDGFESADLSDLVDGDGGDEDDTSAAQGNDAIDGLLSDSEEEEEGRMQEEEREGQVERQDAEEEEEEEEEVFEVEQLVRARVKNGERLFHVRWKGYDSRCVRNVFVLGSFAGFSVLLFCCFVVLLWSVMRGWAGAIVLLRTC